MKDEMSEVITKIDLLANSLDKLAIMTAGGFERVENRIDKVDMRLDNLETKVDNLETKVDNLELGQGAIRNVLIGNQERRMEIIENDNRVIKTAFEKHLGVII